jgi:Fanconi anemia group M protein
VPDVDLVVFYVAVPSEIRSIQGGAEREGRCRGRVVILLAEGTVDEAYFRTTAYKEKKMRSLIEGEREVDLSELQADATKTGG